MPEYVLTPHPDRMPDAVRALRAEVRFDDNKFLLTFIIDGAEHVALPEWVTAARADDLWTTTCCELFLAPAGSDTYYEFNYSPSTRWAAYRFDAYREGMRDLALPVEPHVDRGDDESDYLVEVDQDLSDLPLTEFQMGLSAVIEETNGTISFWALRHPPGPPDFHNRDCFIATLPAPISP